MVERWTTSDGKPVWPRPVEPTAADEEIERAERVVARMKQDVADYEHRLAEAHRLGGDVAIVLTAQRCAEDRLRNAQERLAELHRALGQPQVTAAPTEASKALGATLPVFSYPPETRAGAVEKAQTDRWPKRVVGPDGRPDAQKALRALREVRAMSRSGGPTHQAAELGIAAIEDLLERLSSGEAQLDDK